MVKNVLFTGLSILVLLLLAAFTYREEHADWKKYQRAYYVQLARISNNPGMADTPLQIKQIWNSELGHADRCTTCHMGIANPAFIQEKQPLTTHPGYIGPNGEPGYISKHSFEKFGCTTCHNGDGMATRVERTHGLVEHLDHQLLVGPFVQSSCTKCHLELYSPDVHWSETPVLMAGKKLVNQLGCGACHTIRQMGTNATQAPELSELGSKTELAFHLVHDFSRVKGPHITRQWEFEHFKDPQKIVPGSPNAPNPKDRTPPTIMPNWGLTDEEAEALTVFVLSLKDPKTEKIPYSFLPKINGHEDFNQYRH